MKKFISILAILLIILSCDDKKTQQFGGVNLTISKKVISEEIEDDIDIEINFTQDDIELFPLKGKESKVKLNKNLIFNNFKIKKIDDIKPNDLLINSSENQIADVDAIRVTLNNEQPTTIPIINGSASYSRDGLSIGTIPIKVDLFGGGTNKYSQTKSVSIIANQISSALFNSFSVVNQQIEITNSNFSNTVVQGEQISFDWTNSHAERSVQISVIQDNDNNVIQVLEANYIGSSYALNTNNSNTANNIGFKVSSNIANTSSSICCFDLVANAPQANDISSSLNEDSSVTIQLDASSPGGESVTYSIVSSPSNGSLGSVSGSNVTYTPNQDFNGSDSFTYKANNGSQDSNTATVSITVNNVNDAPVVVNLTTSTAYQQSVSIELNGSDIDGDNLTYFINANPSNGTIAFTGNSTITYNPNSGFSGSDSFNYGANDGNLSSNIATVSITVEEDNSIVVTYPNGGQEFIIGQTYTLLWNNSFSNTGVELRKDGNKVLDINGDVGSATSLSWTVPSGLTTGGGYVIRVYDAGSGTEFDESDETFSIVEASDETFIEQVSIDFTSNNTITTQNELDSNKNYYLKVSGDGSYSGGNRIDAAYISSNSNWSNPEPWVDTSNNDSWMFNDVNIRQSLRPNPDQYNSSHVYYYYFQGNDSTQTFAFKDCNYSSNCYGDNSGGLTVEIYESDNNNTAPTTEDIAITIDENRFSSRLTGITLLGSDVDGDDLTYTVVSGPSNGTASISGATLTYEANQDYNGTETITYKANDGELDSNISTITITVNPVNDNPVVTVGDPFAGNNKSGFFNGSARVDIGTRGDLSGQDVISVQAWVAPSTSSQEIAATVIAKGTNLNSFNRQYGMYLSEDSGQLAWSWHVSTGNGVEVSTYSTSAAEISEWTHLVGTYDGSLVNLYVNGVLTSSSAHSGNINAGDSIDKPLSIGHLNGGNQYYFKGNIDEVAIWDLSLSDSQVNELYNAGLGMNALNLASSDLHAYWNFENDFQDQSGNNRHGTGVRVTFDDNIPTGLFPENFTTNEDTPLNIDISSYVSDVDNDDLAVSFTSNASNGSLTANNLIITYTPNLNFNGNDSFSWSVSDGTVNTGAVNTNIVVSSVNDAPVTLNQSISTDKDTSVDITLNASDAEDESLTFTVVSNVSHGTTSLNNDVITYTPSSGYAGADSFTFKANDGLDDSNISTVSITVNQEGNVTYEIDPSSTASEQVESGTYSVYEIEVTESGLLKDIEIILTLAGERSDHLRYTNIVLTSPQNSRILLMGGDQNNVECNLTGGCITSTSSSLTSTKFTDSSSTFIYNGSPPFVGSYKPNEPFSVFDGEEINGKWKLHILNSDSNSSVNVSSIKMELDYNPNENGSTYIETNTSIFSPSASMGGSLTVSPSSTGIITIPVSLSRNQTIQDLDFEISLDGQRADHLRYITINVDIGDSDNAQLVFKGDQTQSGGQSYTDNHGTMYKARFDAQTNTSFYNTLMHDQRVSSQNAGGDMTSFTGESISEFKIYVYNADSNGTISVDLSNTKVYIYNSTNNNIPIINGDYYVNGRDQYISWIEVDHTSLDPLRTSGSGPFTITDAPTEGTVSTWHPCEDDGTGQGKVYGSSTQSSAYLDCDTIGDWWLKYTSSDDGYDSFDFKIEDIHGDKSNVKTVNIFNTSYGNSASLGGSFPGQGNVKAVPGTDYSAIAIGKELTYRFTSVAEIEKFRLGFFNNATGLGDAVVIEENINGASSNVTSGDSNGIIYKFTLTEDDLLSTMPSEANRIQFNASANYYVYNDGGTLVPGIGSYWQGSYYPNYFPEANDINVGTDEDNATDISLDVSDGDNDNLTYTIVTDASNGGTSLSDNVVTYTPNTDFNGTDTFTYKANDGYVDSNTATVTITVNAIDDAPTIGDPITVSMSQSTGSGNINSVDFQVDISDPDVASSSNLEFYMIINDGSGFQHHPYLPSTWNAATPGNLENAVHTNYGSNIEIWDQATKTFTYYAAVGKTGSENIKFYSRECSSCQLSDDYFEVTIGIN